MTEGARVAQHFQRLPGDAVDIEEIAEQPVDAVGDVLARAGLVARENDAGTAHRVEHRPGRDEWLGKIDVQVAQRED